MSKFKVGTTFSMGTFYYLLYSLYRIYELNYKYSFRSFFLYANI